MLTWWVIHFVCETAIEPPSTSRNVFNALISLLYLLFFVRSVGNVNCTLIVPLATGTTYFMSFRSSIPYPVVDDLILALKKNMYTSKLIHSLLKCYLVGLIVRWWYIEYLFMTALIPSYRLTLDSCRSHEIFLPTIHYHNSPLYSK